MSNPAVQPSAQRAVGLGAAVFFGVVSLLAMLAAWVPDLGLHGFFAAACHQHPERAHWLDGAPMAVCVRCFWLYLGLAVGHGWYAFGGTVPRWRFGFLIGSLVFATTHWLIGWLPSFPDFVTVRALTGFGVGVAVSDYTVPGLAEWFFCRSKQASSSPYTYEPHRS